MRMDIYKDDKRYDEFDLRNRSWRLSTKSTTHKLSKVKAKWNKAISEERFDDLEEILIERKNVEFDIAYDDIRNDLILPEKEIIEFFVHYTELKETNRINFLSWILNKYYKSEFLNSKMEDAISSEDYETAGLFRDLLSITVMPQVKE